MTRVLILTVLIGRSDFLLRLRRTLAVDVPVRGHVRQLRQRLGSIQKLGQTKDRLSNFLRRAQGSHRVVDLRPLRGVRLQRQVRQVEVLHGPGNNCYKT